MTTINPYSPIFIFSLIVSSIFAQGNEGSIYGQLPVKKDYNFSVSFNPQIALYKVNNQKVDKETYYKFLKIKKDAADCCPCLTKTYDAKEKLLREDVLCGDCNVGSFIQYNEDGSTKLKGQFKENDTGNWENIYKRGYCGVADGKWIFYNKKGQAKYVELWDEGIFKKQIPEQNKVEIWTVDLVLEDSIFSSETISLKQVNKLQFIPRFKNKHTTDEVKINVEFNQGTQQHKESYSLKSFSNINAPKSLQKFNSEDQSSPTVSFYVFFENRLINFYQLQITL